MNDVASHRRAGIAALLAIPALVLSVVFIVLFFRGAGSAFGPLNDLSVAATAALLILPTRDLVRIVETETGVRRRWFTALSLASIAGLVLIVVGQVLISFALVSLETSFVTGSLGILPVIAWSIGLAAIALRRRVPSTAVGWSILSVLATAAVVTVASTALSDTAATIATLALLGSFCWFLAALASALLRRPAALSRRGTAG